MDDTGLKRLCAIRALILSIFGCCPGKIAGANAHPTAKELKEQKKALTGPETSWGTQFRGTGRQPVPGTGAAWRFDRQAAFRQAQDDDAGRKASERWLKNWRKGDGGT